MFLSAFQKMIKVVLFSLENYGMQKIKGII